MEIFIQYYSFYIMFLYLIRLQERIILINIYIFFNFVNIIWNTAISNYLHFNFTLHNFLIESKFLIFYYYFIILLF